MFAPKQLLQEVTHSATLSGGPGGQHANKASTKVVLQWDLENSDVFTEKQKERLRQKLQNRLTKNNQLQLAADSSRSQHKNKKLVNKRFLKLIENALKEPKKRKKTKPSKAQKQKRLKDKRQHSEKKNRRKTPDF